MVEGMYLFPMLVPQLAPGLPQTEQDCAWVNFGVRGLSRFYVLAAQSGVDDDAEIFIETPEDIEPTALAKRKAELLRIREAQEARLLEQNFDFCWNPTLGLKLRNGGVANLHGYVATFCAAQRSLTLSASGDFGGVSYSHRFALRLCA